MIEIFTHMHLEQTQNLSETFIPAISTGGVLTHHHFK